MTVDYATADGSARRARRLRRDLGHADLHPRADDEADRRRRSTATRRSSRTRRSRSTSSNPANATIAGTGIGDRDDHQRRRPADADDRATRRRTRATPARRTSSFTVTLSAPSASTVTVDYATVDGSAAAPGDYAAATGTLTFTPGQTGKPITVAGQRRHHGRDERDVHGRTCRTRRTRPSPGRASGPGRSPTTTRLPALTIGNADRRTRATPARPTSCSR